MKGIQQQRIAATGPNALIRPRAARPLRPAAFHKVTAAVAEKVAYKGDVSKGIAVDAESIAQDIRKKAEVTVGAPDASKLSDEEAYRAAAWSVREKLVDAFFKTQAYWEYVPDTAYCDCVLIHATEQQFALSSVLNCSIQSH